MTWHELLEKYPSRKALVIFGDLRFDCNLLDFRQVYGRTDVLVSPVSGTGKTWVSDSRILQGV